MLSIRSLLTSVSLAAFVCLPLVSCSDSPTSSESSDPLENVSESDATIMRAAMDGLIVAQSTTGTVATIPGMITLPMTQTGSRNEEVITPIDVKIDSDSDGEDDVHQVGSYINFIADDFNSGHVTNEAKNTWIKDAIISLVDPEQNLNLTGTVKAAYTDEDNVPLTASYMDTDLKTVWTMGGTAPIITNTTDIDYGLKIIFHSYEVVIEGKIKTDGQPFSVTPGTKGTSTFTADLVITYFPIGSNDFTTVYLTSNCSVSTVNYSLLGVMMGAKWYVAIGEKDAKKHGPFTNAQLNTFINKL